MNLYEILELNKTCSKNDIKILLKHTVFCMMMKKEKYMIYMVMNV